MARYIADNSYQLIENIHSQYPDKPVVILGKGKSADLISQEILSEFFVIGINDAELICPVDVSMTTESWAIESIKRNQFQSKCYMAPAEDGHAFRDKTFIPCVLTNDARDMEEVFQQLESSEFYLGNPLIISATTLAYKLARKSDRNLEVYFVGFDFDFQKGYSSKVSRDFSGDSIAAKKILIETQLEIFLKLKYLLEGSKLSIKHVGSQHFSDISSSAFNKKFHSSNDPHPTSKNSRTQITAEITTNHLGDVELAMMMISRAAQDGADFVKLQMRDVDSFYNRDQLDLPYRSPFGNTFREYRHGLEFTDAEFDAIDDHCRSLEIRWFASVLDSASFKRALDLKMPMIKLPSTISEKKSYLLEVSEKFEGELVLSTGMTDESYLDWVLSNFKKQSKIYILHANSAYPTPLEDCNIAVIKNYAKIAESNNRIVPGYSSHDPGSLGSLLAIASGAQMLEKHVKWGNNPWLHFDNVALDLSIGEFESYVTDVRNAEICLGDGVKRITPSEHHKY